MGSLMPGWGSTAPGVPPKGFEECEDYQGQRSKLQLQRSLSRHSTDARGSISPRGPESLSRGSLGHALAHSPSHHERSPFERSLSRTSQDRTQTLARKSMEVKDTVSEAKEPKDDPDISVHGHTKWWNKFDSSFLNRAVEDNPDDYRKGTYIPQHEAAKIAEVAAKLTSASAPPR